MSLLDLLSRWLKPQPDQVAPSKGAVGRLKDPRSKAARGAGAAELTGGLFYLNNYAGLYSQSPSGRWVVSWSDSEPGGSSGGARDSGLGFYLLYDTVQRKVVVEGNLQRPNNGSVSDNGTFTLEDWLFSSELSGVFYVFDKSGRAIVTRAVKANLLTSAISPNGLFALCQTANSKTEDCNSLFLFDLSTGEELYKVSPLAGWPERYEIDESSGQVIAHLRDLGAFRYAHSGEFQDEDLLAKAMLNSTRYELALPRALRLLESSDFTSEQAQEVIALVQRVRANNEGMADSWKCQLLKVEGLAYAFVGADRQALAAFDQALRIDPKVGVKRKRDAIAKRLARGG